jgi:hypothetical protein
MRSCLGRRTCAGIRNWARKADFSFALWMASGRSRFDPLLAEGPCPVRIVLFCFAVLAASTPVLAQGNTKAPSAAVAPDNTGQSTSQKDPKFETRKKPRDQGAAANKAKTQDNIPAEASSDLVNTMTGSGTSR